MKQTKKKKSKEENEKKLASQVGAFGYACLILPARLQLAFRILLKTLTVQQSECGSW